MTDNEEFEALAESLSVPPLRSMFVELHQSMLEAQKAGFSPEQSFSLASQLFETNLALIFSKSRGQDD